MIQNNLKASLQDVLKMSWRRLEDVLKTSWRRLEDVWPRRICWSWWRRLEDVFWRRMSKANIFVLIKTPWRRLEDVVWRRRQKTPSRRLHQDECFLKYVRNILRRTWISESERGLWQSFRKEWCFSKKNKSHKQGSVKRVLISKVMWLNSLYGSHVKINVGKIFMKLIVKHFPKDHRYHKIFNKNTIKLSYSCMQNMANVITKHNNKLLFQSFEQPTQICNSRDKASCPV